MNELENLGPEVRSALLVLDDWLPETDADGKPNVWRTVRAELLRLAGESAQLRDVLNDRDMDREMAAHAKKELAEARETIKRLNRRVQVAEAGIAEKVKASAPGSLGRALANAAASKAEAELAALKARIAEAPIAPVYASATKRPCGHTNRLPAHLIGKRVRLVVDEPAEEGEE